jgi:hypothetical protein
VKTSRGCKIQVNSLKIHIIINNNMSYTNLLLTGGATLLFWTNKFTIAYYDEKKVYVFKKDVNTFIFNKKEYDSKNWNKSDEYKKIKKGVLIHNN